MYTNNVEQEIQREFEVRNPASCFCEITFQLTNECNFRCDYCYETKVPKKMSWEQIKKIIDHLFPIDNVNYFRGFFGDPEALPNGGIDIIRFNFFGGECLLEIDNITRALDYFFEKCHEKIDANDPFKERYQSWLDRFQFTVQSNGALLRDPRVVALLDKYENKYNKDKERILRMFITVDGCKEFHDKHRKWRDTGEGTWDTVSENIKWYINRYHHEPETKGTITKDTLPYLYKSYLAYKELGFQSPRITIIERPNEWDDNDVKIAEEQYKLIEKDLVSEGPSRRHNFPSWFGKNLKNARNPDLGSCGCNGAQFAVEYSGLIYPCFHFTTASIPEFLREPYTIGDIDNGISDEGLKRLDEMKHMYDKKHMEDKECAFCSSFALCGFCPATNYYYTGDINKSGHYDCKIAKVQNK